jgi:anti-anti-sigma factor
MALNIRVEESRPLTKTVFLDGRLDNESVRLLDDDLNEVAATNATVVVFDLSKLEYISSAGLRSIFRIQKVMASRGGKALLVNPRPQIQKVLEIIRAADISAVFTSVEELDRYLDTMQRKIVDGE